MKTIQSRSVNLRAAYAALQSMPLYVSQSNTLTDAQAARLARLCGDNLECCRSELVQANGYSQDRMTRADLRGNGVGMFHNAEHLFLSYVYELNRVAACEDADDMRRDS